MPAASPAWPSLSRRKYQAGPIVTNLDNFHRDALFDPHLEDYVGVRADPRTSCRDIAQHRVEQLARRRLKLSSPKGALQSGVKFERRLTPKSPGNAQLSRAFRP
jgi:hypothetical protein